VGFSLRSAWRRIHPQRRLQCGEQEEGFSSPPEKQIGLKCGIIPAGSTSLHTSGFLQYFSEDKSLAKDF
ncbi:hypothetical protein GOODEAATRI_026809, partial [Goodea atripinnis]